MFGEFVWRRKKALRHRWMTAKRQTVVSEGAESVVTGRMEPDLRGHLACGCLGRCVGSWVGCFFWRNREWMFLRNLI